MAYCVTNSRAKPQKPGWWKSMLIHQGWFTAIYTQHLLDSQSFKFEICILQALNTLHQHIFTYFSKGGYSVTLLSPLRRLIPSLGLGTTWVRQEGRWYWKLPSFPPIAVGSRLLIHLSTEPGSLGGQLHMGFRWYWGGGGGA